MKFFMAFILVLLFVFTLETLPRHFSKQKWTEEMMKTLEKLKCQGEELGLSSQTLLIMSVILSGMIDMFLVIFYAHLGTLSNSTRFMLFSLVEIATCVWNFKTDLGDLETEDAMDVNNYKYHRVQYILNSILDLFYYPMAICFVLR